MPNETPAIDVAANIKADAKILKALPPDSPAAAIKEEQIVAGVNLLAQLAKQYIPDAYKPLVTILVGAILGAVSAWYVKPAPPAVVIPIPPAIVQPADKTAPIVVPSKGCQCGCTVTGKCVCKDCDHPMTDKPMPTPVKPPVVVPVAAPLQIVLYSTPGFDSAKIAADPAVKKMPVTVIVDPTIYPVGSTVKSIPLPCVAHVVHGEALDAAPLATVADVIQFVARLKK